MTRLLAVLLLPGTLLAQAPYTRTDSVLVGRILLAEDRRDTTATALTEGARHADPRIQLLARRAAARIADSMFTGRDSFPPLPPPPTWPEPEWKGRYRALTPRSDCAAVRAALTDSSWIVRLRAVDVVPATCTDDDSLDTTLRRWILALPTILGPHRSGEVTWHPAAHAIVALARLRPAEARTLMPLVEKHLTRQVRLYAARAAAVLQDTIRLRHFADDPDDNVKEVAIEALRALTGHTDDRLFVAALQANGAQAVRAAALALKGSPDSLSARMAMVAFQRWVGKEIASARDARLALLDAAGRPASDDRPPREVTPVPREAVALALGADVRLRVTMEGGPSFVVRLRGDVAPIMAARILELARQRYYDALVWQRVEPDFVIQGGGPGANEYVGAPRYLRDELGTIPHPRGAVGMSTRGHDTGDAQWFVDLKDNPRLRRDYTVFAEVVEGMEVVDAILEGDRIATIREVPKP
jgi:cyclophilin family peptidyl-prolyl cis-trans isomerase